MVSPNLLTHGMQIPHIADIFSCFKICICTLLSPRMLSELGPV
uniref:Uncharacterized protein n=1 Tax=Arundo donax TaxID=35708 RepID=A0A0A9AND8_ARUDO